MYLQFQKITTRWRLGCTGHNFCSHLIFLVNWLSFDPILFLSPGEVPVFRMDFDAIRDSSYNTPKEEKVGSDNEVMAEAEDEYVVEVSVLIVSSIQV